MTRDPYARDIFHGKLLDVATIEALKLVEQDLGYELTITQGVGGAEASAGTHLGLNGKGGRAVDLAAWDQERKVKALKRRGFAVWFRPARPGLWPAHIHAVLILNRIDNFVGIAASAFRQIGSFLSGRDGLAGDGPDPTPWRADPQPVFTWPPPKPKPPAPTNVTRARDAVVEAMHALDTAQTFLDDADESRVVARAQRDDLRRLEREARAIMRKLPKR